LFLEARGPPLRASAVASVQLSIDDIFDARSVPRFSADSFMA
jgi:hypothetical protein